MKEGYEKKDKEEDNDYTKENEKQKGNVLSDSKLEMDQEMNQSEMEMKDNELEEILDRENLDLEEFLNQGTTSGIETLPQEEINRIQQLFLWKTQAKGLKEVNNTERQSNEGGKIVKTTPGLAPRNPRKKEGGKSRTSS